MLVKPAILLSAPVLILTLFFPIQADSQSFNCDGVIRNTPCGKAPVKPRSDEERQKRAHLSEKKSLLHGLTMSRLRAREEFQVDVDIGSARDLCNSAESPLDECRAEVERLEGIISERTAALKVAQEKERANALQEEANRIQKERNEIEANKPNVTVIQQYPVRRRDLYPPGTYPPGTYPPGVYPPGVYPPGTLLPPPGSGPFPPPAQGGSGVNIDINVR